jgi:hypothetical protein
LAVEGVDFGFQKGAKQIKIVFVDEIPAVQRKPEQGQTGCLRRI